MWPVAIKFRGAGGNGGQIWLHAGLSV